MWAAFALLLFGPFAEAQDPPPVRTAAAEATAADEELELAKLQERRKRIEADTQLADERRRALLDELNGAISRVEEAERFRKLTEQSDSERENLSDLLKKYRPAEGSEPEAEALPDPAQTDITKLEELLRTAQTELATKKVAELDAALKAHTEREPLLPPELAKARESAASALVALEAYTPPEDDPVLGEITRIRRKARRLASERQVASLEAEIRNFAARKELLTAQREAAVRDTQRLERRVAALQKLVDQKRRDDAKAREEAAGQEKERTKSDPVLGPITEENERIARRGRKITEDIRSASSRKTLVEAKLKDIQSAYDDAKGRIKAVGLNASLGTTLRRQLQELKQDERGRGDSGPFDLGQLDYSQRIAELELERFDFADERGALERLDYADGFEWLAKLPEFESTPLSTTDLSPEASQELTGRAKEFLDVRKKDLATLVTYLRNHTQQLTELTEKGADLEALVGQFEDYLNEHVLWIRSGPPIWRESWVDASKRLAETLLGTQSWIEAVSSLAADVSNLPFLYAAMALVLTLLLTVRRRVRQALVLAGQTASKSLNVNLSPTSRAVAYTVFLSFGIAPALAFVGWRLTQIGADDSFTQSLGRGLLGAGLVLWLGEMIRQTCRPQGLADAHFDWNRDQVEAIRRQARWLIPFSCITLLLLGGLGSPTTSLGSHAVGRLVFLAGLPALYVAWHRLWRLRQQVTAAAGSTGRLAVLRGSWFFLIPVVLMTVWILALLGYYYTAIQLFARCFLTLLAVAPLVLLNGVGLRWLLLSRRKLRITHARERREKGEEAEATQVDPREISQQSGQLIRLGATAAGLVIAWFIWSDLVPALNIFHEVKLWTDPTSVEKIIDEDGVERLKPVEITLWNLILAGTILGVTFYSSHKLPSLLEVSILQALKMAPGERYAVRTLTFYVVVATGLALAFTAVGFGWSRIQWIVAAVSVGLGFGLQEIFANFVSGIIILFERPLRVGDIVTVGDIDGRVTRIQIRATTITDWDRRELIVPNREFITKQLVNWTLTDTVTRVVIPVGVAYGSDTDRTTALLLQLAYENQWVLREPTPKAVFWSLGDSALIFRLMVHIPNRDCVLDVFHQLHTKIHAEFRKAGIEIAFPQQDIHLRTAGPLVELMRRGETEPLKSMPLDAQLTSAPNPTQPSPTEQRK